VSRRNDQRGETPSGDISVVGLSEIIHFHYPCCWVRAIAHEESLPQAGTLAAPPKKSKTPLEAGPRLVVIRYNSDSRGSGGTGGRPTHQLTISRAAAGKGSSI
jgi:hypothetical protein